MKTSTITFEGGRAFRYGKLTLGQMRDLKDSEEGKDPVAHADLALACVCAAVTRASPQVTRKAIEDALDPDELGELVAAVLSFSAGKPPQGEAASA